MALKIAELWEGQEETWKMRVQNDVIPVTLVEPGQDPSKLYFVPGTFPIWCDAPCARTLRRGRSDPASR